MTTNRGRGFTALTGGGDNALDSVDGDILQAGDPALVFYEGSLYSYKLDATSGFSEASPFYIVPDTNPGFKAWVLQGITALIAERVFIPITDAIDGTTAPDAADNVASGNGAVTARTFDGETSEDVIIPWVVPSDLYPANGLKYHVACVITAATGPAAEGLVFSLSGYNVESGAGINGTFGTEVLSKATGLTQSQYDIVLTEQSSKVTVTDLAGGDLAMLKLYRDHDHADDTYVQLVGVIGVWLEYTRLMQR